MVSDGRRLSEIPIKLTSGPMITFPPWLTALTKQGETERGCEQSSRGGTDKCIVRLTLSPELEGDDWP